MGPGRSAAGSRPFEETLAPNELRRRRQRLALTQAGLAALVGVTANTLARWERAEQPIGHPERVRRALDALAAQAPAKTEHEERAQLPFDLNCFIGRDHEIDEVRRLLEANRLVTLTGTGGVGKTRLAIRVTGALTEHLADGDVFVSLAPITDPELVLPTIAQVCAIPEVGGISVLHRLQHALKNKQLLLVLDNFEHVLSTAPLVPALLAACPRLKVLVTSRARLRVSGEHAFIVPPLNVPELGAATDRMLEFDSVKLFVERAEAAGRGFMLGDRNVLAVAEICRRLDGLPLAIELAAGVRALNPQELLQRLDHGFDLFVDGARDAPERHQTLRAAISWSYDLITKEEQRVFRRLSVCAGGWTLAAAAEICGLDTQAAALRTLLALVEHGLVQTADGPDGTTRFGLLETVRDVALDRLAALGEEEAARNRHAAYFAALAEQLCSGEISETNTPARLRELEREHDNVQLALRWLTDHGNSADAIRLVAALRNYWIVRVRYAEGRRWLTELIRHPALQTRSADRGRLLWIAAALANRQGELAEARAFGDEAVSIARACDDRLLLVRALSDLAAIRASQGEPACARGLCHEVLRLCQSLGLEGRQASILVLLAECAWMEGNHDAAHQIASEALTQARSCEADFPAAYALLDLGRAALGLGDLRAAASHLEDGLALASRIGQRWTLGFFYESMAYVALRAGGVRRAREQFRKSLRTSQQIGDRRCMIPALEGLAAVDAQQHQSERAFQLAGAADALREALGAQGYRQLQHAALVRLLEEARVEFGSERAAIAWKAGRAMPLEEALAIALDSRVPEKPISASEARPDGLTPRELEVLQKLAEGCSNADAAHALVLSVRTVERHIANLYGKIGARGRADATTYAMRHGLI